MPNPAVALALPSAWCLARHRTLWTLLLALSRLWGVVQFGGMALIAWAAWQPRLDDALGVSFTVWIGLYAVAKGCELNDGPSFTSAANGFQATR